MKEYVLADRPYRDLSDLFITLAFIELQIARITRIQHHALGMLIHSTPIVHRLQQLFAEMLPLELRVHA